MCLKCQCKRTLSSADKQTQQAQDETASSSALNHPPASAPVHFLTEIFIQPGLQVAVCCHKSAPTKWQGHEQSRDISTISYPAMHDSACCLQHRDKLEI